MASTENAAPYADLGRLITAARTRKTWSRQTLADKVGYDSPNGGITISKIERGLMRPSDARLFKIGDELGIPRAQLESLARGAKVNPLAAAHQRRANQQRSRRLNERTTALQTEVERYYAPLEKARERLEQAFLGPFLEYAASLTGAGDELDDALTVLRASDLGPREGSELQEDIQKHRAEVAGSLGAVVAGATAGGAVTGAAVGAGAAFATYSTVAAMASASTGTAISALAGAAASNATLAALGGGSLATGGLGIAGGTVVLAGIVAAPAVLAAGIALFWTSKKWAAREHDESERIDFAELMFEDTERRVRGSFDWTGRALGFLGLAEMTSSPLMGQLIAEDKDLTKAPTNWGVLTLAQRDAARRLLQLAAVTLTVLPLPALPTPDEELEAETVERLEEHTADWNEAVLADAMTRVARVAAEARP